MFDGMSRFPLAHWYLLGPTSAENRKGWRGAGDGRSTDTVEAVGPFCSFSEAPDLELTRWAFTAEGLSNDFSINWLDAGGENARGCKRWKALKGKSFDVTAILFRFGKVFSGTLYLNHKSLTGSISHARKFLSFSGIGGWWEGEWKAKKEGPGMVSVGGECVWWWDGAGEQRCPRRGRGWGCV